MSQARLPKASVTTLVRLLAAAVGVLIAAGFATACGDGSDAGETSTEAAGAQAAEAEAQAEEPAETDQAEEPAEAQGATAAQGDAAADETGEPEPAQEPAQEPAEGLEPLTASAPGVTKTEIHVGITMLDFDALAEFNLVTEGWGDQQGIYQAYVDDLNARGGVHGRTIVPHFQFYSPLGSTEAEAACTALTKDIETFVIIGGFLGPAEVANNCVVTTNDTMMIGGRITAERLAEATAPWVETATARERRLDAFLGLLDENGYLQDRSIAVIGSLEQEDIYDIAPAAFEAAGVEPILWALNDAPQGDTVATDNRWQVLAENIRASGADTVLLIGSTQGGLRGVFDNGLDVETWVIEAIDLESLGAETTPEDAHGAISVNSLTNPQQWEHPTMAPCREIAQTAFPDVEFMDPADHVEGDELWFRSVHLYCRNMAIFELMATAAGPNPTQQSWQAGVDSMGDVALPGVPFASGGKSDLSDTFQLVQFDANAGENGLLLPISDPYDGTP